MSIEKRLEKLNKKITEVNDSLKESVKDAKTINKSLSKQKKTTKLGIGYSPLTDTVYLGKQNQSKGMWVGNKENITQQFLDVAFNYFEEKTIRNISTGDKENLIINIPNDEKSIKKLIDKLKKDYLNKPINESPEK